MNQLLLTDSYKFTHWKQYPPGTTNVYSYFESRGGQFDNTVFFGLQYFLKQYLQGVFVTPGMIDQAEAIVGQHLGNKNLFNRKGWEHILNKHDGRLPVSIKAVPEGSVVPVLMPLMTIENTDPECYWLTNYLETLLVQVWYPCTVATLSREIKKVILKYLEETGDPAGIDFKLHDFGFRGVSSVESAAIGGTAHLVNFMGTDTVVALACAMDYYHAKMPAFSIPAAEHSTITSWGKDQEKDAYENMLTQFPDGLVAVVSDSYNIYDACKNIWGEELKDKVLARNGTLVIRPDSGKPSEVVCKVLEILYDKFGGIMNDKRFKVLNPKVRVIQGDGIDLDVVDEILYEMRQCGFSADNIAFGMGGALLQKLHRDTQKFAFKCSSVIVNGQERDVFKQPVGDAFKISKKGRFTGDLVEVFRDGKVTLEYTFDQIRERAKLERP